MVVIAPNLSQATYTMRFSHHHSRSMVWARPASIAHPAFVCSAIAECALTCASPFPGFSCFPLYTWSVPSLVPSLASRILPDHSWSSSAARGSAGKSPACLTPLACGFACTLGHALAQNQSIAALALAGPTFSLIQGERYSVSVIRKCGLIVGRHHESLIKISHSLLKTYLHQVLNHPKLAI